MTAGRACTLGAAADVLATTESVRSDSISAQTTIDLEDAVSRLNRYEEHRYVGTRDDMVVHDCDDATSFQALQQRVEEDGLLQRNLLQAFAPDSLAEARNRGFQPA